LILKVSFNFYSASRILHLARAAAILLALETLAGAQALDGDDVLVDEIVVEADAPSEDAAILDPDRVVPTSVVSGRELQQMGARNAADAIALTPGVVTTGPSNTADRAENVQIHGFGSEYTLVLVDGERVASRSVDGKFDLSSIGIDQIERVEVVKGPQALAYGADAIGGVVNVVTRSPGSRWRAVASTGYGGFGTFRAGAAVEAPIARRLGVRVFGRFESSDGWTDAYDLDRELRQTTPKDDSRSTRKGEAQMDLVWKPSGRTTARATLRWFDGLADVDRSVHRYIEEGHEEGADDRTDLSSTIKLSTRPGWGGRIEASAHAFWSFTTKDRERDLVHRSGGRFLYREDSSEREEIDETLASGRLGYVRPIGRHLLAGWVEGRWQHRVSTNDGRQQRYDEEGVLVYAARTQKPEKVYDKQERLVVVGIEDEIQLGPHAASAGVRVEDSSTWPIAVTPAVSARLSLGGDAFLRASAGLGYRLPNFEHRTRSSVPELNLDGTKYTAGNPDLLPERSRSLSLGLDHRVASRASYSISAFVNQLFDRIDKSIEDDYLGTGIPLERPVNIGRAWTAGVEVEVRVRVVTAVTARASYTYLWTRNDATGARLNETPTHAGALAVDWAQRRGGWDASVGVLYVSERPRIDAISGLERADSPVGALVYGHARAGYAWRDLRADVEVSNVLAATWDRDNDGDSDLPPPSVFARVTWTYEDKKE
jgi:outer membrane receptor for ferrienterochelin and colicins